MASERDREKEAELESTMYTNCLLLGLDPSVLGVSGTTITARVGHFRHSNPRMGEQLLYFLLSALRGPVQSAKDFDKVWPIFDPAQSRDFRKIVQGIISDLESQGALPRSNSRVSSLATCCGPRFVELLWQLSVHALREVHQRSFSANVASNPLPPELTEMSYLHAASLLPVFKARIGLERRKFLKNANTAVHRQSLHSNLAHEMTAEFRILCAEEAYLQQELEKLQDDRSKAKLEAELWDDHANGSSCQTSHMVSKATRLWESLLARKGQHEVLASGPIEDLIAHREHRYRISGPSLLAAMESSSRVSQIEDSPGDSNPSGDVRGQLDLTRTDDRSEKVPPTVDVAEVLRCWTHALQRIHKQALQLAKANDGEGSELLRSASDSNGSGHAESMKSTLAEHRQHLVSIEGLINQLKEAVPAMQKSIMDLTDEVNTITSSIPANGYNNRSISPGEAQSSGRTFEHGANEITDLTSKLSSIQLEKVSTNPAMKLPHLFSITPNMSGRIMHTQKKTPVDSHINYPANLSEKKLINQPLSSDHVVDNALQGDDHYIKNIRRSVREAALATHSINEVLTKVSPEKKIYEGTQHFFMPLSSSELSQKKDIDTVPNERKERSIFSTPDVNPDIAFSKKIVSDEMPSLLHDFEEFGHCNEMNEHLLSNKKNEVQGRKINFTFDEAIKQSLSPTLLTDSSYFTDTYEDLLAPISETDAALMEQ